MSRRQEKLNQLLQREVSQLLLREVEFPLGSLVTITRVEISPDLRNVKIYLSILPPVIQANVFKILASQIGALQFLLNRRLKMKYVPRLSFQLAESF